MKGYVEKLIKEYPVLIERRSALKKQLDHFKGVSDEDIILAMSFSHPASERVQSSEVSDKTATVAIAYQDKKNQMNDEIYLYWFRAYQQVDEELTFLEEAIDQLPEELFEIMNEMVLRGLSWKEMEYVSCQARSTLAMRRKKAIDALVRIYQIRESKEEARLLG